MGSLLRTTPSPSEQSLRSRERRTARRAGTRRPRLLVPVAAASIALVTAGCGGTAASAGQPAASGPASGSAPAAYHQADPSSSPPAAVAGAPQARRCTTKTLGMSLGAADAGAGQIHYRLTFANKSGHSCTLQGFPGVSMIRRDGSVIGVPAGREGAPGKQTVIGAGRTAAVTLHTLNQGIKGSGCWREPDYLRVYPPGSKEALTLRTSGLRVCGDRFTTTAVEG
ncbi:DUF4232 domain-containing protein [Streptomyces sp. NBC_00304]|uniref:DUF4232 domain-containing protein n=1 Tax=Streptomyces sp. NBC_00304 TaxID=2975706 RepID=UPI002E2C2D1F|nr:DUF4232 domain-containing protein [Streptomyces sp. NBC_00304]